MSLDGETATSGRSPTWTRDELTLTCALVYRIHWREVTGRFCPIVHLDG